MAEDEGIAPGARGQGYRSPALDRLRDTPRQPPPVRRIAQLGGGLPTEPLPDRQQLAALEGRLARLEQQQLAVAANLCEAHEAFRRLGERLNDLARRIELLTRADRPPSSA